MYCNAACKKKHRHKHKKECERRVAELHDEKLFRKPPPEEECPICMIQLPYLGTGRTYMECCGKMICSGCMHAPKYDDKGNEVDKGKCPFCRTPPPSSHEEIIKRHKKRVELNDPIGISDMGSFYAEGLHGLPQSHAKALELWNRAAGLGHADAYYNIACGYKIGRGVERDEKKAIYYSELAAMEGSVEARFNLGCSEWNLGKERALKHFMIAAEGGFYRSPKNIKSMYMDGHATKDDYAKALRAYQAYLIEIKSDQRDKAAAFNDEYKYYDSLVKFIS